MKTWKLVAGILSIIFCFITAFQSLAAGIVDALEASGGTAKSNGMSVSWLMLVGGIVSICTRNSDKNGGNTALIILFGLAAWIGFTGHGIFIGLQTWAAWCMVNAVLAVISYLNNK